MYGKIFESIYEGSLYGQYEAIVTFQALIVLADEDGLIDISPQALSGKTSIPLEVVRKGLKVLQQSDPHSRSPSEDGKRIVLLDEDREFGWRIVNYEYYRNLARRADTREKSRERKRRERERSSQVVDPEGCHADVTPMSRKIAYTDTDTYTDKPKDNGHSVTDFERFWQVYPKRVKKKTALEIWKRKKPDPDTLIADVENRLANDSRWVGGFVPDPTTYLNGERWNDELEKHDEARRRPNQPERFEDVQARNRKAAGLE